MNADRKRLAPFIIVVLVFGAAAWWVQKSDPLGCLTSPTGNCDPDRKPRSFDLASELADRGICEAPELGAINPTECTTSDGRAIKVFAFDSTAETEGPYGWWCASEGATSLVARGSDWMIVAPKSTDLAEIQAALGDVLESGCS